MQSFQKKFIQMAIEQQALQFGEFTLKSGLKSSYFFNIGRLSRGEDWLTLGQCYADALVFHQLPGDLLFGAAYKGIPLVSVTALMLAQNYQRNYPTTYNRKETKDHGEGGLLVGNPVQGHSIILLDDVLTKGTALTEAKTLIHSQGGQVTGVIVALDRQEQTAGQTTREQLSHDWKIPVVAIANLRDIITYLLDTGNHEAAQRIQQGYKQ